MSATLNKPTTKFWIISILALLWNIMGVFAYLGQVYLSNEALQKLPVNEQNYYSNVPSLITGVFALAVFSGVLGSLALILRKKIAIALFIISLIMVIVQFIYNVFIQNFIEMSIEKLTMPIIILAIALFLVWFSKKSIK